MVGADASLCDNRGRSAADVMQEGLDKAVTYPENEIQPLAGQDEIRALPGRNLFETKS